jgi:hypothetical protein
VVSGGPGGARVRWLTEDGVVMCKHELGIVQNRPSQDLVTVARRKVLVENDPEGRTIAGCPMIGPTLRPCLTTLVVRAGYSDFVRVAGKRVCLATITGLTDGTPPGTVPYVVRTPGQDLVAEGPPGGGAAPSAAPGPPPGGAGGGGR